MPGRIECSNTATYGAQVDFVSSWVTAFRRCQQALSWGVAPQAAG